MRGFTKIVICFFILEGAITLTSALTEAEKPSTQGGNVQFRSKSAKPSAKVNVLYQMCLPITPIYINASARSSDTSSTLQLKLTVIKIMQYSFLVQLERTDQNTGWDTMVTVKWSSITGNGFVYNNHQYIWLPDPSGPKSMNKAQAESMCLSLGARLLDIKDKNMYDAVYQYVKTTFVSYHYVNMWLAMDYNISTRVATQSTGLPGFNGVWHDGYPHLINGYSAMGLQVAIDTNKRNSFGLWNALPSKASVDFSLLCSKKF